MWDYSTWNASDFNSLYDQEKAIQCLDESHGFFEQGKNNLVYQMEYSVRLLEEELAQESSFHLLQLVIHGEDKHHPACWSLYADGSRVAYGNGIYVRKLFCQDKRAFLELCKAAVRAHDLPAWHEREYRLLRASRDVACAQRKVDAESEARGISPYFHH